MAGDDFGVEGMSRWIEIEYQMNLGNSFCGMLKLKHVHRSSLSQSPILG